MKKFYFIFLGVCLTSFAMVYYSKWSFMAALAIALVLVAYRFYALRLEALEAKNESLEQQFDQTNTQLDVAANKEIKTNKELKDIKRMREQLLTVLNHEIRTPMNGIMGMSLLLADTPLNKEQLEYTKTIRNCGENLLKTVNELLANNLLNFSKFDHQEQELLISNFDLRNCLEEVLDMFSSKTARAGVDLVLDIDKNIPAQIFGDSKRLQQVLMNLVENALRFTPHGEIFIGVNSLIHGSLKPELRFEVRDTGCGISEERLSGLFKGLPGRKIEETSDAPGLGLFICKKLIELMGGQIEVKSELGEGSSFIFNLPLTPGIEQTRSSLQPDDLQRLQGRQILVVDDNEAQKNMISKQTDTWGMTCFLSASGTQAMEILSREKKIELVLIDGTIDGGNSLELAKKIKSNYPSAAIILLNVYGSESYKDGHSLFSATLQKPVKQNVLRTKIINSLSKDSARSADVKKLSDEFSEKYPLRILIAEDDMVNQKLSLKVLTKLGYQPDLAKNGKEVMEMVGSEHYDVILMDVQMPEMDGLEATKMIRTCLDVQPVIIAMTANVMFGDRDECLQAGMDDYISKPFELSELLAQLEKWSLTISNRKISA